MIRIHVKKRSRKSEEAAAKEIGGRRTPNSGAISGFKGDVKSAEYLLEDKYTDGTSYSLHIDTLKKLEREAFQSQRKPLLRVTIRGEVYYVLPKRTALTLINP